MKNIVIIPTYNEASNIKELVGQLLKLTRANLDILIIDDNSPDGTGRIADELSQQSESVQVLHRSLKQGLGPAYLAGFKKVLNQNYDLICQMDADFSHRPADLLRLIDQAILTKKFVIGSRYVYGSRINNYNKKRLFLSRSANYYYKITLRLPANDLTSGFRCFPRQLLQQIQLENFFSNGYGFLVEFAYRVNQAGFGFVETPITFIDRKNGQSKLTSAIVRESLFLPWRLKSIKTF